MIDKQKLEKENICIENGKLTYMNMFLERIDSNYEDVFFGIMPNNEKIEVMINNDLLIVYKEYIMDNYSVYEYRIRGNKIHNKILIKDHQKTEVFITNTKKQDRYISVDENNINKDKLLKNINDNTELEDDFHLIEEKIINNLNSIFNREKAKTYTKKR